MVYLPLGGAVLKMHNSLMSAWNTELETQTNMHSYVQL